MKVAKKYFTGKPCCRGHICERYEATGWCIQCARERDERNRRRKGSKSLAEYRIEGTARKAARLADRDNLRAQWREAYRRNKSKTGLSIEEWKAKRAAKKAARLAARKPKPPKRTAAEKNALMKAWRAANPGYMTAWKKLNSEKVKARKIASSKRRRAWLFQVQGGRCAICGQRLGKSTHIDHIVPLALGGSNARSNLQLTHPDCNLAKRARDPFIHAQSLGRLL
jgi:5-methylcytosine-specific restriction endonuclease McrA